MFHYTFKHRQSVNRLIVWEKERLIAKIVKDLIEIKHTICDIYVAMKRKKHEKKIPLYIHVYKRCNAFQGDNCYVGTEFEKTVCRLRNPWNKRNFKVIAWKSALSVAKA